LFCSRRTYESMFVISCSPFPTEALVTKPFSFSVLVPQLTNVWINVCHFVFPFCNRSSGNEIFFLFCFCSTADECMSKYFNFLFRFPQKSSDE
jgi:hypothetical protein